MEEAKFVLCNFIPRSLNFLLFVKNIYANVYNHEKNVPDIVINREGLLDFETFNCSLKDNWCGTYKDLEESSGSMSNLYLTDSRICNSFSDLFLDNEIGKQLYEDVWKLFSSWWWPQPYGMKNLLEKISDDYIELIWKRSQSKMNHLPKENKLDNYLYSIIMVFDDLPLGFISDSRFFHIQSLGSIVPIIDIEQLVNRVVKNIVFAK
jgi:hypothetical protein